MLCFQIVDLLLCTRVHLLPAHVKLPSTCPLRLPEHGALAAAG